VWIRKCPTRSDQSLSSYFFWLFYILSSHNQRISPKKSKTTMTEINTSSSNSDASSVPQQMRDDETQDLYEPLDYRQEWDDREEKKAMNVKGGHKTIQDVYEPLDYRRDWSKAMRVTCKTLVSDLLFDSNTKLWSFIRSTQNLENERL